MTTTSPGTHGFPYKAILIIIAAIVLAAGVVAVVVAIGERTETETPTAAETADAATETPAPIVSLGGLAEALADGKLDAGLIPDVTPDVASTLTAPESAVVEGTGSLHDALATGKLDMDYDSRVPFVLGTEASPGSMGLWAAWMSGQIDQGWTNDEEAVERVSAEPVPALSGGHQE